MPETKPLPEFARQLVAAVSKELLEPQNASVLAALVYTVLDSRNPRAVLKQLLQTSRELEEFPLYLMRVGNELHWYPLQRAGVAWDSGLTSVENLELVLESDYSVRLITKDELIKIQEIADDYSGNK